MEQQKNSYNGRFGDAGQKKKSISAPRAQAAAGNAVRKPSGFSSAGAPSRHKSAPTPVQEPAPEKKKIKKQRIRREKPAREPGQRKQILLRVLAGVLVAVLIGLILLIIFGDRGTYHQMPTITVEEAQPSFEPEKTPLPGVQEAI